MCLLVAGYGGVLLRSLDEAVGPPVRVVEPVGEEADAEFVLDREIPQVGCGNVFERRVAEARMYVHVERHRAG